VELRNNKYYLREGLHHKYFTSNEVEYRDGKYWRGNQLVNDKDVEFRNGKYFIKEGVFQNY